MSKCFEKKDVSSNTFKAYVTGIAKLEVERTYTKLEWWKEEKFVPHSCYYCDMMGKNKIIARLYNDVNNKKECEIGAVHIIMQHITTSDDVEEIERIDQIGRLIYHLNLH